MEEDRLLQIMLLDFYGDLLTEKQRECYSMYYNEDFSLSEIAEEKGVSRQAVWDNIRHADAALKEFEEKTGLLHRFRQTRGSLLELREMLAELPSDAAVVRAEEKLDSVLESL